MKLTDEQVLAAIPRAAAPWSGYIAAELDREHRANVAAGGTGHPPRRATILARLRSLERKGLVECVGGPNGYYGYTWRVIEDNTVHADAYDYDDD